MRCMARAGASVTMVLIFSQSEHVFNNPKYPNVAPVDVIRLIKQVLLAYQRIRHLIPVMVINDKMFLQKIRYLATSRLLTRAVVMLPIGKNMNSISRGDNAYQLTKAIQFVCFGFLCVFLTFCKTETTCAQSVYVNDAVANILRVPDEYVRQNLEVFAVSEDLRLFAQVPSARESGKFETLAIFLDTVSLRVRSISVIPFHGRALAIKSSAGGASAFFGETQVMVVSPGGLELATMPGNGGAFNGLEIAISIHEHTYVTNLSNSGNHEVIPPSGNFTRTHATDMDRNGNVCGQLVIKTANAERHFAFFQTSTDTAVHILPNIEATATAMNNNGQVVGTWKHPYHKKTAGYLWTKSKVTDDSEGWVSLGDGFIPRDLNDSGMVTGAKNQKAVVWDQGKHYTINPAVSHNKQPTCATHITNAGWILAYTETEQGKEWFFFKATANILPIAAFFEY